MNVNVDVRIGKVTDVNKKKRLVRVKFEDTGITSGWLPVMQHYARKPGDWYIVKMDIAKFFFRIPVDVQLRELSKPLDDPDMVWFLEQAIRCDGRPLGLPVYCTDVTTAERISGIGMQVGSLISQMTANVVMTPTDYYIKRELQVPEHARFMDDMMCIVDGNSKEAG